MTPARLVRTLVPAALLVLPAPALAADAPYADPWNPATEAAAEAAVARLGAKRALNLVPSILTIQGVEGRVVGQGSGIVATVQEVRQAMQALGAQETDLEVRVALPADVLFDFDKADIRSDAAQALAQLATLIRAYPSGRAELEGHTDSKGDDAYNQRLSQRRAEAVKRWLVEREGIAADRLATRGAGESRPVASNDDDAGRQRNRRVEAVIHKQ
ncbi:MAG TPA: OmpA family protein [Thermoanaerobaculia bacterium]|jgi:outer membrane protein OmpA-like peptidoglycan-associated protein